MFWRMTLLAATVTWGLAGCSETVYYAGTEQSPPLAQGRSATPALPGQQPMVTLHARGLTRPEPKALSHGGIAVVVVADSPTSMPVSVTDLRLEDSTGRSLGPPQIVSVKAPQAVASASGRQPAVSSPAAPSKELVAGNEYLFYVPADMTLGQIQSFRVFWTVRIGATSQHRVTTFVRPPAAVFVNYTGNHAYDLWEYADTSEAGTTGLWYGIIGPPFGD